MARGWPGLEGLDLAKEVSRTDTGDWDAGTWMLGEGYQSPSRLREGLGEGMSTSTSTETSPPSTPPASGRGDDRPHVVEIDYGAKDNIFRSEEHTYELQSLMRHSYGVLCLKKKKQQIKKIT